MTNSDGKINETILKVKFFFSFVNRHSLIVIRLLLHKQLKLPVLQKELSGHGTRQAAITPTPL